MTEQELLTSALRKGDVVVGIDGRVVRSVDDIHRALQRWPIVAPLSVKVLRERALVDLELRPVEAPV